MIWLKGLAVIHHWNAFLTLWNLAIVAFFHHQVVDWPVWERQSCFILVDDLHCSIRPIITHISVPWLKRFVASLKVRSVTWLKRDCQKNCQKILMQRFDPVMPLYFFVHSDRTMKHTREIALFLAINNTRLTDNTTY